MSPTRHYRYSADVTNKAEAKQRPSPCPAQRERAGIKRRVWQPSRPSPSPANGGCADQTAHTGDVELPPLRSGGGPGWGHIDLTPCASSTSDSARASAPPSQPSPARGGRSCPSPAYSHCQSAELLMTVMLSPSPANGGCRDHSALDGDVELLPCQRRMHRSTWLMPVMLSSLPCVAGEGRGGGTISAIRPLPAF